MIRPAFALVLLLLQAGSASGQSAARASQSAIVQTARRLGQAYYEEGNYRAAAEQFRRVLRAQPGAGSFTDHLNLGLALVGVPDEAGALAELETARQMDAASPAPLYALGILHKRQGRFREALDYLERAQKAGAADIATLFNIGAVLMSLGRSEEALAYFQRVLDRGFDFGPGWYVAAEYRISRLLQRLGRAEEAAAVLRRWEARRKATKETADSAAALELGPLAMPQVSAESVPPRRTVPTPVFAAAVRHSAPSAHLKPPEAVAFDYDVDGDLDRLLIPAKCGAPRLERNNGNDTFSDVTVSAGLVVPGGKAICAAVVADFDNDGDSDIVAVGPEGAWLFSNLRGGKFAVSAPFGSAAGTAVATADLDADGAFDLVFGSPAGVWVWWNRGGPLTRIEGARAPWTLADLNGDGLPDIAAVGPESKDAGRLQFWLNLAGRRWEPRAGPPLPGAITAIQAVYLREGALSLLALGREGAVWTFDRTAPQTHWLRLNLEGTRSNKAGVGAVVELKAGNFYTRAVVGPEPLTLETGALARLDVVRVTWPNGIVQNVIETPVDRALRVAEQDRLASSCPLLYLWDGTEFRFFAEVLSSTPLGEPDGRGGFILPGVRERVFLPAEKLRARNGRYVFQLTEELREAVYLDQARLVALDHPAGTRAFVDEAYRGAPLELPPVTLADVAPVGFRRKPAQPSDDALPGLVEQHAVYFALPLGADFLVLRGWTYWMDSNVATAASQDPARAALPPRLEAQQADGSWQTVIGDLGLPSGPGRLVLADLRGRLGSSGKLPIPLRIVTNLRVSWEEILGGKVADAPRQPTALPLTADLHYRGFSVPVISPTRSAPDFYDYARLLAEAPWDALPGRYTRFGNILPLVVAEDGRLAVLGAGDELTLEFPADAFPPLPGGWRRDFVLELSGWVKAGETNTASSERVEPLPFRGMKQYPYRPVATPAWQRRWLTRRPMPHLPPLAPAY